VGKNGAGKTTLMKAIATYKLPGLGVSFLFYASQLFGSLNNLSVSHARAAPENPHG
jgi:ABC-type molybdenum transport system ATPase subunit/photorepair protein PhrA